MRVVVERGEWSLAFKNTSIERDSATEFLSFSHSLCPAVFLITRKCLPRNDEPFLRCRGRKVEFQRAGTPHRRQRLTHHVESLPNAAPLSEHKGDFSNDRILQRNHRLEQPLVLDFAWFQVDIGTGEDSLHRAILGREPSVPACKAKYCLSPLPIFLLRYTLGPANDSVSAYLHIPRESAPFLRFPTGGHSASRLSNCKQLRKKIKRHCYGLIGSTMLGLLGLLDWHANERQRLLSLCIDHVALRCKYYRSRHRWPAGKEAKSSRYCKYLCTASNRTMLTLAFNKFEAYWMKIHSSVELEDRQIFTERLPTSQLL